jgi:hypothetical protein
VAVLIDSRDSYEEQYASPLADLFLYSFEADFSRKKKEVSSIL